MITVVNIFQRVHVSTTTYTKKYNQFLWNTALLTFFTFFRKQLQFHRLDITWNNGVSTILDAFEIECSKTAEWIWEEKKHINVFIHAFFLHVHFPCIKRERIFNLFLPRFIGETSEENKETSLYMEKELFFFKKRNK